MDNLSEQLVKFIVLRAETLSDSIVLLQENVDILKCSIMEYYDFRHFSEIILISRTLHKYLEVLLR